MAPRQLHMALDNEFAALLALYTRGPDSETPRTACLKSLRLRAQADGHLHPDGTIKTGRRTQPHPIAPPHPRPTP